MNECAKCGATTEGGQFYRFYFGVVVHDRKSTPTLEEIEAGPSDGLGCPKKNGSLGTSLSALPKDKRRRRQSHGAVQVDTG
jgi:hypothetical protein